MHADVVDVPVPKRSVYIVYHWPTKTDDSTYDLPTAKRQSRGLRIAYANRGRKGYYDDGVRGTACILFFAHYF